MNISELIQVLKEYPSDMRVVVNGYECGYDDLSPDRVSVAKISLNAGKHSYEGKHGELYDGSEANGQSEVADALVLARSSS